MKKSKYTDKMLQSAVKYSSNMRQVLQRLGLSDKGGGSYKSLLVRMQRLGIDRSHMTGTTKGQKYRRKSATGILNAFVENSTYQNIARLKIYLIENKILERQCNKCKRKKWVGKLIPLELHHKNGHNNDHRFENVELLCPNCHSQTSNYSGKNK